MTSSNKVKGFAAGVVAAVCYGTNPLGTLELYGDGFNSSSVLIYRYLLAVLMFAVVMLFRKESFKVKWGHLIRLGVLGCMFRSHQLRFMSVSIIWRQVLPAPSSSFILL